jgi:hypothetical protein
MWGRAAGTSMAEFTHPIIDPPTVPELLTQNSQADGLFAVFNNRDHRQSDIADLVLSKESP